MYFFYNSSLYLPIQVPEGTLYLPLLIVDVPKNVVLWSVDRVNSGISLDLGELL